VGIGRYLVGLLLAGVAIAPIVAAASSWRSQLLPMWYGAQALLADTVITLAAIVCTAELLGSVGMFRLLPMTAGLAAAGSAAWFAAHRRSARDSRASLSARDRDSSSVSEVFRVPKNSRLALFATLVAISLVVADWSTRTVYALSHGMRSPDTIWYHMPFAARFVQDGSITALHFVGFGSDIAFYPQNGELVHALGILFLGNDFLSPLLNMGWLALALLAAWCVGRPFGVAPVTLAGIAIVMATPGLATSQPGGAYTDIVGLALLTSTLAFLVNSEQPWPAGRLPAQCVAALAAGLALGTKFTLVAPVVALTVGLWILAPRGHRLREGYLWLLLVALTGGFWYLRNLLTIGNLLPYTLHLGPITLAGPPGLSPTSTVASFLFVGRDWRTYFLPGLRESLGPAWWAILGLMAAGFVIGVAAPYSRLQRMLAIVGVATGVAFVFTPQPLTVPVLHPHVPYDFVYNLRYSFTALIIGLAILPISPVMTRHRSRWWLLGAFGLVLIVMQLDSTIWPTNVFPPSFVPPIRGIDSAAGLFIGVVTFLAGSLLIIRWRQLLEGKLLRTVLVVATVAAMGLGFGLQQLYLKDRYLNAPPMAPLYAWARHVYNARLAITGPLTNDSYPLYGQDDSNYVQLLGKVGPRGSFLPILNCAEFRRTINAGHYSDVLTVAGGKVSTSTTTGWAQTVWTSTDPKAKLIFRRITYGGFFGETVFSVFRLGGPLDPGRCP
jgi:hypothetical protein